MSKKKLGKALAAGLAAYGASKMLGGKEEVAKTFVGGNKTGDANIAENIAIFDRGMDRIARAGGVSKLNKGSKGAVTAKCKMGRNKATKLY